MKISSPIIIVGMGNYWDNSLDCSPEDLWGEVLTGGLLTTASRLATVDRYLQLTRRLDGTTPDPIAEIFIQACHLTREAAVFASDSVMRAGRHSHESDPGDQATPQTFGAYALSAGFEAVPRVVDASMAALLQVVPEWAQQLVATRLPTVEELAALVAIWLADVRELLQRVLDSTSYEFADHAPPNSSSPCGLLRMAAAEIPRGPQLALQLETPTFTWTLAA
ncbi:hypothetical protein ABT236_22830 [Streptomyces sp. NPDC001523]|uniref:hypothetical protein n=1 Tax=Streptomyces sp. NPDC001523 TaxID=3154383 RepID=UPI0033241BC1